MRRRLTVRSDAGMSFMWWLKWHGCVSNVLMVSQVLRIANECRALAGRSFGSCRCFAVDALSADWVFTRGLGCLFFAPQARGVSGLKTAVI